MKLLMFFIFFLQGCSSYISQMHRQLDSDYGRPQARSHHQKNKMSFFKKSKAAKNKKDGSLIASSRNASSVQPEVKRHYKPSAKKRYTAKDLIDNENQGSLWTGKGQRNFLFSKNKIIKNGDIIVIQVEKSLKKEISLELNRAFPKRRIASKPNDPKNPRNKKVAGSPPPKEEAAENNDEENKAQIFDKISSVVVEEVNKDYLLLRGRKDVIFNRAKRMIEVEMLVARKDITEDDTILSSNTFEKTVNVLR